jgi:hypothetical protein
MELIGLSAPESFVRNTQAASNPRHSQVTSRFRSCPPEVLATGCCVLSLNARFSFKCSEPALRAGLSDLRLSPNLSHVAIWNVGGPARIRT